MRKIFLLMGVMLLFIGALAHAPPVNVDPDVTVEFLADNLDADYDILTTDAIQIIEINQVALPLTFEAICLPEVTLSANPGTSDVNLYENTKQEVTKENLCLSNNLFWCNDRYILQYSDYRLILATNENPDLIMGLPCLGVGKSFGQTSTV